LGISFKVSPKLEVGLSSIHLGVLSILLILHSLEVIIINPIFFKGLLMWVAINLLAFPVARSRFVTPSIVNPKCPYCESNLVTVELYCEKCKSTSKAPKEEK